MFMQLNYVRLVSGWGVVGLAVASTLVVVGVLRHAKPSDGVSTACRYPAWRNSPIQASSCNFACNSPE